MINKIQEDLLREEHLEGGLLRSTWKGSVIRKMEEVEFEKIIPSRPTGSFFMFLQKKINEKLKVCQ